MKKVLGFLWGKFRNNMGIKIFAIILAFIIWAVVTNHENPVKSVTFYDIPVVIVNEEHITQKDKTIEILSGEKIDVTIEARLSVINSITEQNIIAIADFDKITMMDTVPIEVGVTGYTDDEVEIKRGNNEIMRLSLEDYSFKEFKVNIETSGAPAEGYVVGGLSSSPSVITVSGSKTQLSRIQKVVVTVSLDALAGNTTLSLKPVVYDMNDEIISSDKLEVSVNAVQVTANILNSKEVSIYGYSAGEVRSGFELGSIDCYPSSVVVAGTTEDLKALGNVIKAYVDVTDATGDVEETYDVEMLLDSLGFPNVIVVSDDKTLVVKAAVTELQQKEVTISASDVTFSGLSDKFTAVPISISSRKIIVRGTKGWLEGLTSMTLTPTVDLSNIKAPGTYTLPITFADFQGVEVTNDVTITIKVGTAGVVEE